MNKFCSKSPNLRSLSKIDKGVIALAHTLEQEYNGGRGGGIRAFGGGGGIIQKRQQPPKAMTVIMGKSSKQEEKQGKNQENLSRNLKQVEFIQKLNH